MGDRQKQQNQGSAGQQQSGQQQQFDAGTRQPSGAGGDARLAEQIRPHQEVVDQNGVLVGTVDHIDGERIKLTRDSSADGDHHYVPLSQVAGIDGNRIRLRDRGDASFGVSNS